MDEIIPIDCKSYKDQDNAYWRQTKIKTQLDIWYIAGKEKNRARDKIWIPAGRYSWPTPDVAWTGAWNQLGTFMLESHTA